MTQREITQQQTVVRELAYLTHDLTRASRALVEPERGQDRHARRGQLHTLPPSNWEAKCGAPRLASLWNKGKYNNKRWLVLGEKLIAWLRKYSKEPPAEPVTKPVSITVENIYRNGASTQ